MYRYRLFIFSVTAVLFTLSAARSEIIVHDFSDAPEKVSATSSDWNIFESGRLYISQDGVADTGTDLEVSLMAMGLFTYGRNALITLGDGFSLAQEGDQVNEDTFLNGSPQLLVSASDEGESDVYDDYLAILLDAGDGTTYYGWAEVIASAVISPDGRESRATFSIQRLVYNAEENSSIQVGTIPEPAAVLLIAGSSIALLAARRIFKR